jgi:hypothetical protein
MTFHHDAMNVFNHPLVTLANKVIYHQYDLQKRGNAAVEAFESTGHIGM